MSKPTNNRQGKNSPGTSKDPKSQKTPKDQDQRSPLREYARYSTLGFQMLFVILLFVFGGMKLDDWVQGLDFPLFTLLGAIVGVVLGIYYAIRDVTKL